MKITINLKTKEGTTKEQVERELRKFLAFQFWNSSEAEVRFNDN